jgi:hypothetical protein
LFSPLISSIAIFIAVCSTVQPRLP